MAAEGWSAYPFAEVIDFQEGPGILAKDFREFGTPLVRLSGLDAGASVLAGCNYLDPMSVTKKWSHFSLQEGDILLSTSASLGRVATVGPEGVGAIAYTGIIRMRPRDERIVARFIRYLLAGPEFQHQVEAAGVGSVIRHFGPMHLRGMTLHVPRPGEQRAIAHILGTFDDKIELNRRMNATLEAIARAIFKSWFVDFDPVRAKASSESPESICKRLGLTLDLLALFPDRFVDSELGEIPEGWEVVPAGNIIERLPAGKKYEQKTVKPIGTVPVLDQGRSGVIGYHDSQPGVIASPEKPVAVFANHTCYMRLIHFPFSAIQNVLPFVGKGVDTIWAFYATAGKQSFIEYKGHWPDFVIKKIVVPNTKLASEYSALVLPMLKAIWRSEGESITLGSIRDTLLPRLLSGKLRVIADGQS